MATYTPAKRATAFIMYVGLPSQASPATMQSNPTIASGDFKVSKDGGALANLTNLPAVTPASSKMVQLSLTGTEMTADNVTIVCSDASGSEWSDVLINIHTAAQQFDDLATQTSVNTIDDLLDTEIGTLTTAAAAIQAKTDNLPSDPADQSLLIAATDAILTAVGDVPTNAELATALGTADDAVLTQIALVKAKTDSLTFTVAGQVDANIKSVAGTTVTGTGTEVDPWGP